MEEFKVGDYVTVKESEKSKNYKYKPFYIYKNPTHVEDSNGELYTFNNNRLRKLFPHEISNNELLIEIW